MGNFAHLISLEITVSMIFVNYNNNHTVFHNITVQCDRYNTATNHYMVIHNEQHKLWNLLVMKILCFTVCVFSFFVICFRTRHIYCNLHRVVFVIAEHVSIRFVLGVAWSSKRQNTRDTLKIFHIFVYQFTLLWIYNSSTGSLKRYIFIAVCITVVIRTLYV